MKKIGLSLLVASLLAACASQQTTEQATQQQPTTQTQAVVDKSGADTAGKYNPLTDPKNILSQRNVFFDFDKYNVKEEFTALIKAHAGYLNATPAARVSLQGNCDERGTAEYNLALGQRRADAVKKAMQTAYGVDAKKVETISYGKERPVAQGHDEAAWAQNRRTEIVYSGEAKFPKQ
ncbi:peptidoglycan-associated lipoprotein [Formivibrio citricus]|uniref:Peptidoglycan-associated lipoprotein n=2 Tax=Formivibrio citricus TaxID=83765 RepID=A0A1I4ZHC6_9NEIS|nr:peptidoglycan-associated lipoprotein [Formivibrio citricus]